MNCSQILAADMAAMEEYALLAGPVPRWLTLCNSDARSPLPLGEG